MYNITGWSSCWGVDDKGKYSHASVSTSQKDNRSGEYINSSWGDYVTFVKDAHGKVGELLRRLEAAQVGKDNKQPVRIKVTNGGIKWEKYTDKAGVEQYPKRPQIVIFDFEFDGDTQTNTAPPDDDGDIPF